MKKLVKIGCVVELYMALELDGSICIACQTSLVFGKMVKKSRLTMYVNIGEILNKGE